MRLLTSPFFTPQAMLWNIKTLGLGCWLQCFLYNVKVAAVERCRAIAGMDAA
jgi:hypothetical protein